MVRSLLVSLNKPLIGKKVDAKCNGCRWWYGKLSSCLVWMEREGVNSAVQIGLCFASEGAALDGLRTVTLDDRFGDTSIIPVAIIHALQLLYFSSAPLCTSTVASASTNTATSNLAVYFFSRQAYQAWYIFFFRAPHVLRFISSVSGFSSLINNGRYWYQFEVIEDCGLFKRSISSTNVSMKRTLKRTGTAIVCEMEKTTQTLETSFQTCTVFVSTILAC